MIQRLTVLMETFINWNMNVVRHSFLSILLLLLLAVFLLGSSFPLFARHFYVIKVTRDSDDGTKEKIIYLPLLCGEGDPSFYAVADGSQAKPRGGFSSQLVA